MAMTEFEKKMLELEERKVEALEKIQRHLLDLLTEKVMIGLERMENEAE